MKSILRSLAGQPILTIITVVTIAVGIGASATMFTFTYGTVVRGLDVRDPDGVVAVEREVTEANTNPGLTLHDLAELSDMPLLQTVAAFQVQSGSVETVDGQVRGVSVAAITPNVTELLDVSPVRGRLFDTRDAVEGAPPVALLRATLWREWFGEDPDVVGRSIRVDGVDREVVGILPAAFGFPWQESLWVPMNPDEGRYLRGEGPRVGVVARLAPGESLSALGVALSRRDQRLARAFPDARRDVRTVADVYTVAQIGREIVVFMKTMLGAVFLVLAIACINVANIVMSRTTARSREVAVRRALGGSRGRIVASLLGETMVQALVGGTLGLVLARWATQGLDSLIVSSVGGNPFYWISLSMTPATLVVTVGLVVLATLAAGLVPAVQATRVHPATVLRDQSRGSSSRGSTGTMRKLVTSEVALCVSLLAITGVMLASVATLRSRDWGFDPEQFLIARYSPPALDDPDESSEYWRTVLDAVREQPGVVAAALSAALPLDVAPYGRAEPPALAGRAKEDLPLIHIAVAGEGYFSALGIDVEGRDFGTTDTRGSEGVVIINEPLRESLFGEAQAVGASLRLTDRDGVLEARPRRVVGVVPDLGMDGTRGGRPAGAYVPLEQVSPLTPAIVVRLERGVGEGVADNLRRAIVSVGRGTPAVEISTMREHIAQRSFFYYFLPLLFGAFGLVAFGLAAVGVFGVTAYSVTLRRGEFGIRMALGARPSRVRNLVLGAAARQAGVGILAGLGLAALMAGGLTRMIVNVNARDPRAFALASLVMMLTAVAAALPSAIRSARQDPAETLRSE